MLIEDAADDDEGDDVDVERVRLVSLDSSNSTDDDDDILRTYATPVVYNHTSIINLIQRRARSISSTTCYTLALFLVGALALTTFFRVGSTLFAYLSFMLLVAPMAIGAATYDIVQCCRSRSRLIILRKHCCAAIAAVLWMWVALAAMEADTVPQSTSPLPGPIFIAANLYNSAHLFPHFHDSLLRLVEMNGGAQSAYISIYESNSDDGGRTSAALHQLKKELDRQSVQSTIVTQTNTSGQHRHLGIHDDGEERIAFLASIRNAALEPLGRLPDGSNGKRFFKVLWLNDVYFDAASVMRLLHTHSGVYDAACAFDFTPLGLYDTWVARDIEGKRLKPLWPYFANPRDVRTLKQRHTPILINSCWNGAAAFDAKWFTNARTQTTNADVALPLRFRTEPRCLSSECLLLSLDIHRALAPRRPRIYMRPDVRVAYNARTFYLYNTLMHRAVVRPWDVVWQQVIQGVVFARVTDMGRSVARCQATFSGQWSVSSDDQQHGR